MKILFLLLVLLSLGACSGQAYAADGHWVLDGIWNIVPDPKLRIKTGILLSHKLSSTPTTRGIITKMEFFKPEKTAVIVDKYFISWEWTAIPVAAKSGDEIPMTLRGTVQSHPTWKNGFVGHCYPLIKAEFWKPQPGEWDYIGGFTTGAVQFSSSDEKNKSGLKKITGTYPSGSKGAKLALVIHIEHPSDRWDRQYVYKWDPAPFPTDVPDPIPPGQITLDGSGGESGGNEGGEGESGGEEGGTGEGEDEGGGRGEEEDPLKGRPAGMTLQADRRTVKTGGSVTVPVRMLNGKNVGNLDFKVSYDPSVVRLQGKAIKGNLLDNASMQSNPADSGRVWVAFAATARINGDGTIVQIPFEAIGRPGQKTVLGLEVTIFNESSDTSQITKINGEIEILTASGRSRGDMNGNNVIDAADALEALKMAVRLIPMNLDADMDNDNTVTSADARIILRKAMKR